MHPMRDDESRYINGCVMRSKLIISLCMLLFSAFSFAANSGKITYMLAASKTNTSHTDVVQISIEGGFSNGACDTAYAGIRKSDSHLISLALTAYTTGKPVTVYIDAGDVYYPATSRCVISSIYF